MPKSIRTDILTNMPVQLLTAPYTMDKKPKRAPAPHSSLKTLTSGSVSKFTYNHAVRPITATRGGKEGNNAFADDLYNDDYWNGTRIIFIVLGTN